MKNNLFKKDIKLKLISLLTGIVIWFYIMGEIGPEDSFLNFFYKNEQAINNIPVYILQDSKRMREGFIYVEPKEINIIVKGKKKKIQSLTKDNILVYVDVSHFEKGKYTSSVQMVLPQGVSLVKEVSPVIVKVGRIINEEKSGKE